jgi:hypothetical protein
MVLAAFGHGAHELDAMKVVSNSWFEAARTAVAGDNRQAAELYARIGCPPDEARARLRLAADLLVAGRPTRPRPPTWARGPPGRVPLAPDKRVAIRKACAGAPGRG